MATRDAQDKAPVEPAVRPSRPLGLPDVSVSLVDGIGTGNLVQEGHCVDFIHA